MQPTHPQTNCQPFHFALCVSLFPTSSLKNLMETHLSTPSPNVLLLHKDFLHLVLSSCSETCMFPHIVSRFGWKRWPNV